MNCDICLEPFDHSIHKPYILSCPHTYCIMCLNQLNPKKCPDCNQEYKSKYPNIALLKFIPESNYDKLKGDSLKSYNEMNELKQEIKFKRVRKLKQSYAQLESIKDVIITETAKLIFLLQENQEKFINEVDTIQNGLVESLDPKHFEECDTVKVDWQKSYVEENKYIDEELVYLNLKNLETKNRLNQISEKIDNFKKSYKFSLNNDINLIDGLVIGELVLEKQNVENQVENMATEENLISKEAENDNSYYHLNEFVENKLISYEYLNKGNELFIAKKYQEAIQFYNKSIQLNPNYSAAYKNKGVVLAYSKKFKEAIQCYDKAIELKPTDSDVYKNKGAALAYLKKYKEAIQCYDKAIELNPIDSDAYINKGANYVKLTMNHLKS